MGTSLSLCFTKERNTLASLLLLLLFPLLLVGVDGCEGCVKRGVSLTNKNRMGEDCVGVRVSLLLASSFFSAFLCFALLVVCLVLVVSQRRAKKKRRKKKSRQRHWNVCDAFCGVYNRHGVSSSPSPAPRSARWVFAFLASLLLLRPPSSTSQAPLKLF